MADILLDKFKSLFSVAKLPDREYVKWFQGVVEHAQKNCYPIAYQEFFDAKEWKFQSGEPLHFPPFEPTDPNQISDKTIIEFALEFFDDYSSTELRSVLDYNCVKPSYKEIANVIRQAIIEKKGLISHKGNAYRQFLTYKTEDILERKDYEGEIHLKLKNGESVILKDTIIEICTRD